MESIASAQSRLEAVRVSLLARSLVAHAQWLRAGMLSTYCPTRSASLSSSMRWHRYKAFALHLKQCARSACKACLEGVFGSQGSNLLLRLGRTDACCAHVTVFEGFTCINVAAILQEDNSLAEVLPFCGAELTGTVRMLGDCQGEPDRFHLVADASSLPVCQL